MLAIFENLLPIHLVSIHDLITPKNPAEQSKHKQILRLFKYTGLL